jgi:hypothetical protein
MSRGGVPVVSTLDYQPILDGAPADPGPDGGAVSSLALYSSQARTGTPITIGAAVRVRATVYRFTIDDTTTDAGRYWARVTWTPTTAGTPVVDDLPFPLDLPVRPDLVVSPEELATRLGLPLPISAADRTALADSILDAQTDVVSYLGRPILPALITERRSWPWPLGGWKLSQSPVIEVITEIEVFDDVDQPTGYWDVTYRAGLDARSDESLRPIRRLVLALAAQSDNSVRLWTESGHGAAATDDAGLGPRRIKSVSAEGQSVSYEFGRPGDAGQTPGAAGAIGGPIRWASIDQWRIRGRRVFQRSGPNGGLISVTVGL